MDSDSKTRKKVDELHNLQDSVSSIGQNEYGQGWTMFAYWRLKGIAPSAKRESFVFRMLSKVEEKRGLLMKFFM